MNNNGPMHTRVLQADLETPVSAYLKLRALGNASFLYESVEGPKHWSRYSILGFGARRTFSVSNSQLSTSETRGIQFSDAPDPLRAIRDAIGTLPGELPKDAPGFVGGIFGFLSYDAVRSFEPVGEHATPPEVPDAYFVEPELVAVFDNRAHTLSLYAWDASFIERAQTRLRGSLPEYEPPAPWEEPQSVDSRESFIESVGLAKEHIRAGDIIQVVLSRRFQMPGSHTRQRRTDSCFGVD